MSGPLHVDRHPVLEQSGILRLLRLSILGSPLWVYLLFLVLPCLFLVAVALQPFVHVDLLMRDPLAAAEAPAYYGFVSNTGVVIWCATAGICVFSGVIVWQAGVASRHGAWFLIYAAGLTTMLMVDDFFMLHEVLFSGHLSIEEHYVFGTYGLAILIFLLIFRHLILSLEPIILLLCFIFLALSMFFDMFLLEPHTVLTRMGEDGSKLIGICLWSAFHLRASWRLLCAPGSGSTTRRPEGISATRRQAGQPHSSGGMSDSSS